MVRHRSPRFGPLQSTPEAREKGMNNVISILYTFFEQVSGGTQNIKDREDCKEVHIRGMTNSLKIACCSLEPGKPFSVIVSLSGHVDSPPHPVIENLVTMAKPLEACLNFYRCLRQSMAFNDNSNLSASRMLAAYIFSCNDDSADALLSQRNELIMGSCIIGYVFRMLVFKNLVSRFIIVLSDELVVRV